jgi:cytosolic phospholipase A2
MHAMCAARLFRPLSILWGGALATAATVNTLKRHQHVRFDAPAETAFPRDIDLIAHGKRSIVDDAKARQASERRENEKKIPNEAAKYGPAFEDDDQSAWSRFSKDFNTVREGISRLEWAGIGGKITDYIRPSWALAIPAAIQKLQFELSMKEGSLADDVWNEAHDPDINPEITWDATVRIGSDLCREEKAFRRKRQQHVAAALAKYLNIPEKDIDPQDVPVIAMCGSGGGLRALVASTSSWLSAQEAGLFDCVSYTAGVSGSCWLLALYNSSLTNHNFHGLIEHLKNRIGTHIAFPPDALQLITSAPTNKYLLSGFIEKLKGDPGAGFGLVDIYGLLLGARLLVPHGDLQVNDRDLKLSNQRTLIDDGHQPLPIYTAVRHEIPAEEVAKKADSQEKERIEEKSKQESWFQWFEFTPYETFCEEFGAGIPTYALGRPFKNGRNQLLDSGIGLPEIRIPLMLGIWGSAFCATLSHYYKEIRPVVTGLAGFDGLDALLEEKNDDLVKIHPIDPATIPNFVYGMKGLLPSSCPESVFKTDHLQLMDAGMSNNLPIYPLLRPGRDVDVIIAFDASADIQRENWISVVDGYARQRGIKGWPMGAGWPHKSTKPQETANAIEEAETTSSVEVATKIAEARENRRQEDAEKQPPEEGSDSDLSYCTVWVGRSEERISDDEPPPSKWLSFDDDNSATSRLTAPTAGLALIYFPLLPNPKCPGVDPDKTDFMSTWNFIYTPENIDEVAGLAKANFEEGKDQVKRTVRAVYERKKALREKRESEDRINRGRGNGGTAETTSGDS